MSPLDTAVSTPVTPKSVMDRKFTFGSVASGRAAVSVMLPLAAPAST